MRSEMFLGGAGWGPGRMEKGDSTRSGEQSGDTQQGRPPAPSLLPLPRAFLLSPFLSGVKPIPLLMQNHLANLLFLLPGLLPTPCPRISPSAQEASVSCISLSKGPQRDCAVRLLSDHFFTLTMKKESGRESGAP